MRAQFHRYHEKSLSEARVLVTGGAGFIGSNIVRYLLQFGVKQVTILDNLSNGHFKNIKDLVELENVRFIEGDIRDFGTCQKAMNGVEYVTHQAALGSVPRSINDPIRTNDVNITGFLHILEAAKEQGISSFVYAASSSTYGDSKTLPKIEENIGRPLSPYAITKLVDELYAQIYSSTYSFGSVGLRYFNVFGPFQDPKGAYAAVIPLFLQAATQGKMPVINGDGTQTRDFTFVDNAVEANIRALFDYNNKGTHDVFNVAFGERTELLDVWKTIARIREVSHEVTFGPPRQGDIKDSLADISKAKVRLGYSPRYDMNEGLEQTALWFQTHKAFIYEE